MKQNLCVAKEKRIGQLSFKIQMFDYGEKATAVECELTQITLINDCAVLGNLGR